MEHLELSPLEVARLLAIHEGHFADVKSIDIQPAKLTNTLSAFANAEGGEVYIGIDEIGPGKTKEWRGFRDFEAANAHIQVLDQLFPLGRDFQYTFLSSAEHAGLVLKVDVMKTADIKAASSSIVYQRRGAQNLQVPDGEPLLRLRRNKGLTSFERETVAASEQIVTNSAVTIEFMIEVVPTGEPGIWLRKKQLILDNLPTVAAVVLFAEEPQAILPKRSGIKVYRYQTSDLEGTRDSLAQDPISVEGHAYAQIYEAVRQATSIIESVRINTSTGLVSVNYPTTALHEIITNAVLHRDYQIADDIHIRIFDNRVEIASPGTLPANITPENILTERFARNPASKPI